MSSAGAAAGLCRWAGQHDASNTNSLSHTHRGPSGLFRMAMGDRVHCFAEAAPPEGQRPSRKHARSVEAQPSSLHAPVGKRSRGHLLSPSSDATGMLVSYTPKTVRDPRAYVYFGTGLDVLPCSMNPIT